MIHVANETGDSYSVIDGATNTVVRTAPLGDSPSGSRVNLSTNRVYFTLFFPRQIRIIDGATGASLGAMFAHFPWGVDINPATNRLYVAMCTESTPLPTSTSSVLVVDLSTHGVIANVPVGARPTDLAVNPVTNRIYTANWYGDTVSVIDGATNTVLAMIPVGRGPNGIGIDSAANRVYVAHVDSNDVWVIDAATNAVIGTIPVGGASHQVKVDSSTGRIYVGVKRPSGNVVLVLGTATPEMQIQKLIDLITSYNLKQGIANSLDAKLQNALAALEAARNNNLAVACNQMGAFINEVNAQSSISLTAAQAQELSNLAMQVKQALGCP